MARAVKSFHEQKQERRQHAEALRELLLGQQTLNVEQTAAEHMGAGNATSPAAACFC